MHLNLTRSLRRVALGALALPLLGASTALAAPSIQATPTIGLDPSVTTPVTVTGSEIPLSTGTPPGTGLYAAQIAIVDGAYYALHGNAKLIKTNPTGTQVKLEDDGSFTTTVDVVGGWTAGSTAVDCTAADTACFVASWPAHGNPNEGNIIDAVPLSFGDLKLSVAPATDLEDGQTVTVEGANIPLGTGTPPGTGLYAAQIAIVDGSTYYAHNANAKLITANPTTETQVKLQDDGSFTTAVTAVKSFTSGGTTVDCTAADTACFIASWPAHGVPTAGNILGKVAISFRADPAPGPGADPEFPADGATLSVAPSAGLPVDGPTTVTVTGTGYPTDAPGLYVVYGPLAGTTDQSAYHPAAKFIPSSAIPSGSFSTTLTVEPTYANGNGQVVNCTVVQCYVRTFRAHGTPDPAGAWSRAVPISFASSVATPERDQSQAPDAPPPTGEPPSTGDTGQAALPAPAPNVSRLRVRDDGRVSLRVDEPSTVTFVIRRKVGKRWKVVERVEVKMDAGELSRKLPIKRAGRYRVTVTAVGESGARSEPIVKTVRVKANGAAKQGKRGKKTEKGKRGDAKAKSKKDKAKR
jgi:hypothetical protein